MLSPPSLPEKQTIYADIAALANELQLETSSIMAGIYHDNSTINGTNPSSNILSASQAFMFYGLSVIIPFGLIFNTLSVVIFMSQSLRRRSASWYLAVLGISDDISLVSVFLDYWMKDERIGIALTHKSEGLCISVTYMSYFSRLYSACIITSFTIERFIGVVFPLKRATLRSTSHVRKVLAAEAMMCLLATSFTLFTIGVINETGMGSEEGTGTQCDIKKETAFIYGYFNVFVLIFGSIIIPIIVICSLNAFMLRRIWLRKKYYDSSPNMTFSGNRPFGKRQKKYNTATVLLAVSSVFVILNLPYCITWVLLYVHYYVTSLGEGVFHPLYAAKNIATVPYYFNYGINFLVYNICARMFRDKLFRKTYCLFAGLKSRTLSRRNAENSECSLKHGESNGLWHNLKTLSKKGCTYSCPARRFSINHTV